MLVIFVLVEQLDRKGVRGNLCAINAVNNPPTLLASLACRFLVVHTAYSGRKIESDNFIKMASAPYLSLRNIITSST